MSERRSVSEARADQTGCEGGTWRLQTNGARRRERTALHEVEEQSWPDARLRVVVVMQESEMERTRREHKSRLGGRAERGHD